MKAAKQSSSLLLSPNLLDCLPAVVLLCLPGAGASNPIDKAVVGSFFAFVYFLLLVLVSVLVSPLFGIRFCVFGPCFLIMGGGRTTTMVVAGRAVSIEMMSTILSILARLGEMMATSSNAAQYVLHQ